MGISQDATVCGDCCTRINNCSGFSLVELLIAATLSLAILLAMMKIFISQQSIFKSELEIAEQVEQQHLIDYLLRTAVSHAGYVGCAAMSNSGIEILSTPPKNWPSWLVGSDLLAVSGAGPSLATVLTLKSHTLVVEADFTVEEGRRYVLSDCQHSEIVQIAGVAAEGDYVVLSTQQAIQNRYQKQATLSPLSYTYWYVDREGTLHEWREGDLPQAWVGGLAGLKISEHEGVLTFSWRLRGEEFRTWVVI